MHGWDQTPHSGQSGDYGDVADAVAGVLRAAEEAAEKIRGDARTQALEIVERAQGEADTRIAELTREAVRTRTEADDDAQDRALKSHVANYGSIKLPQRGRPPLRQ